MANPLDSTTYRIDKDFDVIEWVKGYPAKIKVNIFSSTYPYHDNLTLAVFCTTNPLVYVPANTPEINITGRDYYEDIIIDLEDYITYDEITNNTFLQLFLTENHIYEGYTVQDSIIIPLIKREPNIEEDLNYTHEYLQSILSDNGLIVDTTIKSKYDRILEEITYAGNGSVTKTSSPFEKIKCTATNGTLTITLNIKNIYNLRKRWKERVTFALNGWFSISTDNNEYTDLAQWEGTPSITITKDEDTGNCHLYGINEEGVRPFIDLTLHNNNPLYLQLTNTTYYIEFDDSINPKKNEGFSTTLTKIQELQTRYRPPLNGNDPTITLVNGYDFTAIDDYGGGYSQCGYLTDGFNNHTDWELTMTLTTSQWDGGLCLFLNPYEEVDCNDQDWNCIFKNDQKDIYQWIDGNIKTNQGSNLTSTGISYTRDTTIPVKLVKNGDILKYYENNILKGETTNTNLTTKPKAYIGTLTWGNRESINKFTDVDARTIKNLNPYLTDTQKYPTNIGSSFAINNEGTVLKVTGTPETSHNESYSSKNHYKLCFDWKIYEGEGGGFLIGTSEKYWLFDLTNNGTSRIIYKDNNSQYQYTTLDTVSTINQFPNYVPVTIIRNGNDWNIDINNGALEFSFTADVENHFGPNSQFDTTVSVRNMYITDNDIFKDNGTKINYNPNWQKGSNVSLARNYKYTTFSNTSNASALYKPDNWKLYDGDIAIEWDNWATAYQLDYFIVTGTSDVPKTFGALYINKQCHVKITIIDTTVKCYIDGVEKTTYTINRDSNNKVKVRLQINPDGDTIKYSNFRIYHI